MMTQEVNTGVGSLGVFDPQGFEQVLKVAETLMRSDLVPSIYQAGNDSTKNNKARANVLIALNMAKRMQADPLMVMQNLYIVHQRPAWSSQFLIGCFNSCGRFSALQYKFTGEPGADDYGCFAWAVEHSTGQKIEGSKITLKMARDESWSTKSGSKWKTMPDQMLRYRAATFFIRTTAPEIAMGLQTKEELEDIRDVTPEYERPAEPQRKSYSNVRVKGVKEPIQAEAQAISNEYINEPAEAHTEAPQSSTETIGGVTSEPTPSLDKSLPQDCAPAHQSFKEAYEEQKELGL